MTRTPWSMPASHLSTTATRSTMTPPRLPPPPGTERSHTRVHVCNLVTKKRVHTRVYSAHARVQLVCNSWVLNSTGIKYTFIYQLIFKMYMYYFSALFSILDQHRLILTRNPIKQVRTCPTTQPTWQCLCWSLQPWKTCLLQRQCAGGQHKWCFLNQV